MADSPIRVTMVEEEPHVILMDIGLPGMQGPGGVKALLRKFPEAQIVMLTVFEESAHIFESICNGACGYLLKNLRRGCWRRARLRFPNGSGKCGRCWRKVSAMRGWLGNCR